MKKFSIVMATLNSGRTIEKALAAIREQNYPQDLVEIMVIDGGSTDQTLNIAGRYNCKILANPKVEPVSAKLLGLREATGDYLMHVDSDEVLVSKEALSKRAEIFERNKDVMMIFSSGYLSPQGVPFVARYINEFGDPFSMFYYRLSKDERFFIPRLKTQLTVVKEEKNYLLFGINPRDPQPIFENAACANAIRLKFFIENFPDLCNIPGGPVHFFYHMQKLTGIFAVTKNDGVLHFSADHWRGFLGKIKWRVRNNVYFSKGFGTSGFVGRIQFDSVAGRLKKYLYIPYTFLIFPVLFDSVYLSVTRKDKYYLFHTVFSLYTAGLIAGMTLLKLLGHKPNQKSYGDQQSITKTGLGPTN